MKPVDRFYRVRFSDHNALHAWMRGVLDYAANAQRFSSGAVDPRPVVFVSLLPERRGLGFAYVSEGARGLAVRLGRGAQLDETVLPMRELPDGLSLLFGDAADASAYRGRLRPLGDGEKLRGQ